MARFDKIIGQKKAKNKLSLFIDSYSNNGNCFPVIFLKSPKGFGKTFIAKELAKIIPTRESLDKRKDDPEAKLQSKKTIVINCSGIKNLEQFIELWQNSIQDKECVVLFDECHQIPNTCEQYMLSLFDTITDMKNAKNQVEISRAADDYVLEVDFQKQIFIFATTEYDKVFHALTDRFEEINLEKYTKEDRFSILKQYVTGKLEIEDDLLREISTYCENSPRKLIQLTNNLIRSSNESLSKEGWELIKGSLGLKRYGLSDAHMLVLSKLSEKRGSGIQLSVIASILKTPRNAVQKTIEPLLIENGLIETREMSRRFITLKGIKLLERNNN
tara:strand:+ start:57361 stop:58350 length:990 start_codon:yes stop_codon:yes gene_type:complete